MPNGKLIRREPGISYSRRCFNWGTGKDNRKMERLYLKPLFRIGGHMGVFSNIVEHAGYLSDTA